MEKVSIGENIFSIIYSIIHVLYWLIELHVTKTFCLWGLQSGINP